MEETLRRWLFDPFVGKAVVAGISLILVYVAVQLLHRSIGHYVANVDARVFGGHGHFRNSLR